MPADIITPIIRNKFRCSCGYRNEFRLDCFSILPVDSKPLFEFLRSCENSIKLIFNETKIHGTYSNQMMEKSLLNKEGNAVTSFIWMGGATNESVKCLSNALKGQHNQLTELVLLDINDITDESVQCLSDALKSQNCKLRRLAFIPDTNVFERVKIQTEFGSDHSEDEGFVSGCRIGDKGIKCLCDALKDEQCKLKELYLNRYDITENGFKYLTDAIGSENCKLELLIICNGIENNRRIVNSPAFEELCTIAEEKNIDIKHFYYHENEKGCVRRSYCRYYKSSPSHSEAYAVQCGNREMSPNPEYI